VCAIRSILHVVTLGVSTGVVVTGPPAMRQCHRPRPSNWRAVSSDGQVPGDDKVGNGPIWPSHLAPPNKRVSRLEFELNIPGVSPAEAAGRMIQPENRGAIDSTRLRRPSTLEYAGRRCAGEARAEEAATGSYTSSRYDPIILRSGHQLLLHDSDASGRHLMLRTTLQCDAVEQGDPSGGPARACLRGG